MPSAIHLELPEAELIETFRRLPAQRRADLIGILTRSVG
jgi:hypothetical protein